MGYRPSATEREHYHSEGYLHLRGVVRTETLDLARSILDRWASELIETWYDQGLITDRRRDAPFETRLLEAWRDAGQPSYLRSPRRDLVGEEMYRMLTAPEFLDIAETLLGTPEVSVHGVFNGRAKMPDQAWTNTPWHQDAQYFKDAEYEHVPTFWFPLQDVDEHTSCLEVQPRGHEHNLYEDYHDEESGFLGLSPEVTKTFNGVPIPMNRGDLLCFAQRTPHRATPNRKEIVRWSMDFRYEATDHATVNGAALGLVARSRDPGRVTSSAAWLAKWDDIPRETY